MRNLGLYFLIGISFPIAAQCQITSGFRVLDAYTKEPLANTLIRVLQGKDSLCLYKTVADKSGSFNLPVLGLGRYLIVLSINGYFTKIEWLEVDKDKPPIFLKNWLLSPDVKNMEPALVMASPSREVHGDTISFVANHYHTRPYAMIGELLNKMPGIDVDNIGQVNIMGKIVERVLVNGKPFFSNDPTIAINHLPRDLAYRIDIFEDRSDEAKFTGVDDGVRILTINIITDNEIKKALLGDLHAGYGTDELYSIGANLHYTEKARTASAIVTEGNSPPNLGAISPLGTFSAGAVPRRYQSTHGKFQFQDSCFGNKGLFTIDFVGSHTSTTNYSTSNTQYLLPNDSSFFSYASHKSKSLNSRENLSIHFVYQWDHTNQLILNSDAGWGQSNRTDTGYSATSDEFQAPVNNSLTGTTGSNANHSIPLDLSYGHRFHKRGRSLYIKLRSSQEMQEYSGTNDYINQYYLNGLDSIASSNQYFTAPNHSTRYGLDIDYTEPIGLKSKLQFHYGYSVLNSTNDRSTFVYNNPGQIMQFDSLLSDYFSNRCAGQQMGLSYGHSIKQNLSVTATLNLKQESMSSYAAVKQPLSSLNYFSVNPTLTLRWKVPKGQSMDMRYAGNVQQPSPQQLQPVIDNIDPLHVKIGNPELKESYTHQLEIGYRNLWNNTNGLSHSWWVNFSAVLHQNAILQKTSVNLLTGADTTTPENLNGNYNFNVNGGYSFPIAKPTSTMDLDGSLSNQHTISYINNELNPSSTYIISGGFHWKSNLKKLLDANISANATYNIWEFPLLPLDDVHYWLYSLNAVATAYTSDGWQLMSQLNFESYRGRPAGLNPTVALWNMTLSRQVLKKRQGVIKLSVHDILNQNTAITHVFTPTMIQENQSQLLTRFFMLSFTYILHAIRQGAPILH